MPPNSEIDSVAARSVMTERDTGQPGPRLYAELTPAPPITLHDGRLTRSDGNSPVHFYGGRTYAFVSHYHPIGHTYRRVGEPSLRFGNSWERTRILGDPDPTIGKWIESTWRAPDGRLYAWCHAEEVAACPRDLRVPHVGALASDDDGASWMALGVVLRAGPETIDCDYKCGFVAGGVGDFTVVPDMAGRFFYLHYSSYLSVEAAQGICVLRYPISCRDRPTEGLELWTESGWARADATQARPIWVPERSWRYSDPQAFWGPAVHYNRSHGLYVMLLNRTANGEADWRQEGIYVSANADPAFPVRWSTPTRVRAGGEWYPQVIGLESGGGDAMVTEDSARFFMAGSSAATIRFRLDPRSAAGS
jgi:hypothetical protein